MAQKTLRHVQDGREITAQDFESAWGSNLPHNQQYRCSLRNMQKSPDFDTAGRVYKDELLRLDPNLEEDRVRDAKILYVDFLMWQKSQDANLTEPPNDYG